jgi:hypothetical protein
VFGHWLPGRRADELTLPADVLLREPAALGSAEAAGLLGSAISA